MREERSGAPASSSWGGVDLPWDQTLHPRIHSKECVDITPGQALWFLLIEVKCGPWKRGQKIHIIWYKVSFQVIFNSSIILSFSKSCHLISWVHVHIWWKKNFFKAQKGRWETTQAMHNYFLCTLLLVICALSARVCMNRIHHRAQSLSTICGHLMIILFSRLMSYFCNE